ncbi:MAG: sensor histidine kinase [Magnetococcales bacterium]|nr:sensor histidine kinase [Magnetococcales bacterium]
MNILDARTLLCMGVIMGWLIVPMEMSAQPQENPQKAEDQAQFQMNVMLFRIKMFHQEVKSTLHYTMDLGFFREYFSLPESKYNTVDAIGVVQFSEAQKKLRRQMEQWSALLHERFVIGEVCLIDRTGQEHMRTVRGQVEDTHFFSNTESDSPFFAASFARKGGEIHVSQPYMSPDSRYWVVAYSSPVLLENGEIPAFFHFEIPLNVYSKVISTKDYGYMTANIQWKHDTEEEGQFFIIDQDGLLIADNHQEIRTELFEVQSEKEKEEGTNFMQLEQLADYLPHVSSISQAPQFLDAVEKMRSGKSGVQHFNIGDRPYVLIFQPIPETSWSLAHLDPVAGPGFWERMKHDAP